MCSAKYTQLDGKFFFIQFVPLSGLFFIKITQMFKY